MPTERERERPRLLIREVVYDESNKGNERTTLVKRRRKNESITGVNRHKKSRKRDNRILPANRRRPEMMRIIVSSVGRKLL